MLLSAAFLEERENAIIANRISSPIHIKPEWYFLFVYAILRSVPHKLAGFILLSAGLLAGIVLVLLKPINHVLLKISNKHCFWSFILVCLLLTWVGANPVAEIFIHLGLYLTAFYFGILFLIV
jgi:quinol-cytochrome oxidoreductase complex cytochrome b subunit